MIGDLFLRNVSAVGLEKSYLLACQTGPGLPNLINRGQGILQHSAEELINTNNEPRSAFIGLYGSYFGDVNTTNNLLRATLAIPSYGLGSFWTPTAWRFENAAFGEHLGAAILRMYEGTASKITVFLGDPTLRLHVLPAPATLSAIRTNATTVNLSWPAVGTNATYLICRGADEITAFTTVLALTAQTSYVDSTASAANKGYMVRTAKRQLTGSGSYTNLSQGIVVRVD